MEQCGWTVILKNGVFTLVRVEASQEETPVARTPEPELAGTAAGR